MRKMESHDDCHSCSGSAPSVRQTLDEMDFERGIWYAAQQNDLERVEHLLKTGTPVNNEDSAGYTALHYAARSGHHKVCKTLLQKGANVNAVTRSGRSTALHRAAMRGHLHIVELLLKANADPNLQDADGSTALHRAVTAAAIPVCQVLIKCTNLQLANNEGRTVLHLAIERANKQLIDALTHADKTLLDLNDERSIGD